MRVPRMAIPRVAYDKLLETCMFHATRKRGPRKHVTGFYCVTTHVHACKNEVIIEQYCRVINRAIAMWVIIIPWNGMARNGIFRQTFETLFYGMEQHI